jgi:predicted RNase H-like nuclease (RuvC/YqgF family)
MVYVLASAAVLCVVLPFIRIEINHFKYVTSLLSLYLRQSFSWIISRKMASSDRCSVCRKVAGTSICRGCKELFCDDDFKDHRGMLMNKLDELTVDRNDLQEKINKATSQNQSGSSLLSRIDEWQRTTIEKVKQAAEQARQQVLQIMNSKREEITRQFQTMSQEMKELRDTKSVVERDLAQLKQQIDQLNEDLKQLSQLPIVELNMKQSDKIEWRRMIRVEEKPIYAGNQQSQLQPRGKHVNRF